MYPQIPGAVLGEPIRMLSGRSYLIPSSHICASGREEGLTRSTVHILDHVGGFKTMNGNKAEIHFLLVGMAISDETHIFKLHRSIVRNSSTPPQVFFCSHQCLDAITVTLSPCCICQRRVTQIDPVSLFGLRLGCLLRSPQQPISTRRTEGPEVSHIARL